MTSARECWTWVLPMAGLGTRVRDFGPSKPLIEIHGRPVFAWCLTGLQPAIKSGDRIIVSARADTELPHELRSLLPQWLDKLGIDARSEITEVSNLPSGPAHSVLLATEGFTDEGPVVVVNPDQFCVVDFPERLHEWDGFVAVAFNNSQHSSYVSLFPQGQHHTVSRIWEKTNPHYLTSTGVYGFRDMDLIRRCLADAMKGPYHHGKEYFVGPALDAYIQRFGITVLAQPVRAKFDLGNPEGLREFNDCLSSTT